MLSNNLKNIKLDMLNQFKKQLNDLIQSYVNHTLNSKDFESKLKRFISSWELVRIDLKNIGNKTNSIDFTTYNDGIKKLRPSWFKNDKGTGYIITTDNNNENLTLKCNGNGVLWFSFKGVAYRDSKKNKSPVFVHMVNISINDEIMLKKEQLVSHGNPFVYKTKCKDSEKYDIKLSFNTIYDYFPYLNKIKDKKITLEQNVNDILKYINSEISNLNNSEDNIQTLKLLDGKHDTKKSMSYRFESNAQEFEIDFQVSNIPKRYFPQIAIAAREGIQVMYRPLNSKNWMDLNSYYLESPVSIDMSDYISEGEFYEIRIYVPILSSITGLNINLPNSYQIRKIDISSERNIVVAGGPLSYGIGCTSVKNMFSNILERKFDANINHITYNQKNYLNCIWESYNNNQPIIADVGILELDYFMQNESVVENVLPEVISLMKQRCRHLIGWYVIPSSKSFKKIITKNIIKEYLYDGDIELIDFSYLYDEEYEDICVYSSYFINDSANIQIYKKLEENIRRLTGWNI